MDAIHERTRGKLPVSIATSLALEGITGQHDNIEPTKPLPLHKADALWFNLRTLFRNIYGAIPKDDLVKYSDVNFVDTLFEEMLIIRSYIDSNAERPTKVMFYTCSYKSLARVFKKGKFKSPSTDRQKLLAQLEQNIMDQAVARYTEQKSNIVVDNLFSYDSSIQMDKEKCFIVTHLPMDLLLCSGYKELFLLESHTGILKDRRLWNTKLTNGKNHMNIPFDKMSIQIFGDGNGGVFSPIGQYRAVILKIAEQFNWNALTTPDRVKETIRMAHEPILAAEVREMYG